MYYCPLEEQRESGTVEVGYPKYRSLSALQHPQQMQEAAHVLGRLPCPCMAHGTLGGLRDWEGWWQHHVRFIGISGDRSPAAVTCSIGMAEFRRGPETLGMETVDNLAGWR